MIAPEVRGGSNGETGRRRLLRRNLLVATLIFLAFEAWRPFFFLTDDNLDGGLPFFTEVGKRLLAGHLPYTSEYLFGGHYNLLRDPTFFSWHPLYIIASLLAGTPLRLWIIDVDAFALFMLTVAGFVNLAWYLRRELALRLSDGWIMFYTLSFTYSMIALTTGSSWLTFLGSQSALPWLTLGILQRSWRASLGLIALFSVHQLLGSHPQPTISNGIFLSLFAIGISAGRRSWQPVLCWAGGYALAILVLSPFLIPLVGGFLSSSRSHGVDLTDMSNNNIPFSLFPTSLFCGMALWIINPPIHPYTTYTLALGSCAAAWCLVAALAGRGKWSVMEQVLLGLLLLIWLMVCRPDWVSAIMARLPLLKSLRWPFRELLQFQFFLHVLLVVRRPGFSPRGRLRLALFGSAIYLVPMLSYRLPPTFNSMTLDRHLLFSGGFDSYWSQVRPLLKPDDRLAVIIPFQLYCDDRFEEPYSLLSTYNYSCLTHVINVWGWSGTPPNDQLFTRNHAFYPFGAFRPEQKAALLAERPDLKFITLESLDPLRITLSSGNAPPVDLTPFIPKNLPPRQGGPRFTR